MNLCKELTPQQRELEKVDLHYEPQVSFHDIYCPCHRCSEQRETEKIRRENAAKNSA